MIAAFLATVVLAQPATAAPPPSADLRNEPAAPLFEVAIGGNGLFAGEDENAGLFPVGGAPASFAVDVDGSWWVLDAIGSRVVVLERDGRLRKTFPFPLSGKDKRPTFRSDLDLDGHGGLYTVDATARRVERWSKDGSRVWNIGSEKIPRGQGALDLPQRVDRVGENVFVADRGSERLLRFDSEGEYKTAVPGDRAVPLPGGGYGILTGEGDALMLETTAKGAHGRPVMKLAAAEGQTLHDATLAGATAAADVVICFREGGADAPSRVRAAVFDRAGTPHGGVLLPLPADDATPVRRWRVTPAGTLAWFRVKDGRFQAFETALPARAPEPAASPAPR